MNKIGMIGRRRLGYGCLFASLVLFSGMAYANQCAVKALKVPAVCGRVEKADGGSFIAGANVALMDESGNRVQNVQADADGKFEFHDIKKGKYRLIVDRATPNWVVWPLEVSSSGADKCSQPLVVKVDPVLGSGSCMGRNSVEKEEKKH